MLAHHPTLLIAMDFNEKSLETLKQSLNLAKGLSLEIVMVYVMEESNWSQDVSDSQEREHLYNQMNQKLENHAATISNETQIPVHALLLRGKPHEKILEAAIQYNARIIMMGTNDDPQEEDHHAIGSQTTRVIRQSNIPVITINQLEHHKGCRKILLPIDLSFHSAQKTGISIEIAKIFNSQIHIFGWHAFMPDENEKAKLISLTEAVSAEISSAGIPCSSELYMPDSAGVSGSELILQKVNNDPEIDLIVLMTRKERRLISYFLGSEAQEIIRKSKVPVLSVVPVI